MSEHDEERRESLTPFDYGVLLGLVRLRRAEIEHNPDPYARIHVEHLKRLEAMLLMLGRASATRGYDLP